MKNVIDNYQFPKWPSTQTASSGWIRIAKTANGFLQEGSPTFCKGYVIGTVEHPDGVYLRWQGNGQSLVAQSCDTGFIPCFWFADNDQVVLATFLEDLLVKSGIQPQLDIKALSTFFRLGFFLGNTTPFQNVNILGPAQTLTWNNGVIDLKSRVQKTGRYAGTRSQAIKIYADLFHNSMKKICAVESSPIWLPLSGGRDSRHIAIELNRLNYAPAGVISAEHPPGRSNDDINIARKLASDLGWKFVPAIQGEKFQSDCRVARATDFLSYEHGWTIAIARELERVGATSVFDGVAGDILSAGLYQDNEDLEIFEKDGTRAFAERLQQKWSWLGGLTRNFNPLGSDFDGIWNKEMTNESIEIEFAKHIDSVNPIKEFYFWNRSRRGAGLLPFKILGKFKAFAPYLDRDLQLFLRSLPHEITADKSFHSDTIQFVNPNIGQIRYANDTNKIEGSWLESRKFAFLLFRKIVTNSNKRIWRSHKLLAPVLKSILTGWRNLNGWNPKRIVYLSELGEFVSKIEKEINVSSFDDSVLKKPSSDSGFHEASSR